MELIRNHQADLNPPAGKLNRLKEFNNLQLRNIYNTEKKVISYLPKLVSLSESISLADTLNELIRMGENHVKRSEKLAEDLDIPLRSRQPSAIDELIAEGMKTCLQEEGMARDAAIILTAQKLKHYEMAAYTTLLSVSRTVADERMIAFAEEAVNEAKECDHMLSRIAELSINVEAAEVHEMLAS